jgi:hypothetical protein
MHSTVFELAENPIAPSSYASPGYLPDWFYFSVCDYAEAMSPEERERSIQSLKRHFRSMLVGQSIIIIKLGGKSYVRKC